MGLDRDRFPLDRNALDDIGIERSLNEKTHISDPGRLFLENVDEELADDLSLLLGLGDTHERRQKSFRGIDRDQLDAECLPKQRFDFLALVLSHHAVVDEDAGQLIADCTMDECRRHRGVDAARKPAHRSAPTDLGTNSGNGRLGEGRHRPGWRSSHRCHARNSRGSGSHPRCERPLDETARPRTAARSERTAAKGDPSRTRDDAHALGQIEHTITVAHPDRLLAVPRQSRKERIVSFDLECGATVLAIVGGLDPTAQRMDEHLQPVADAQDRDAQTRALLASRSGASWSWTELGPPERMMPVGANASIASSVISAGWSSQ